MPEISIVIPCFNYGRFLDQAVESVLAQSCQDFEIVIVDDGSTDPDTRSLLDRYRRSKTTVLRTENRGPAAARNTGIRTSDSKYVVCLDADDRLHRCYLEKTRAILDADHEQDLGFVTTWQRRFGDDDSRLEGVPSSPLALTMANSVHGSSLFRRRAWESVDGYRESFTGWEDWNLWLNMVGEGYRWEVVPEELFYYRKHGETRSSRSQENRYAIFEAIVRDNAELYRENHQEILKTCYRRLVNLENVWLEKDLALSDNRTLSRQLEEEQESHKQALEEHRQLEEYCRELSLSLEDAQASRGEAVRQYQRLEEHCRKLESSLEEAQASRGEAVREYRRLEEHCHRLESARPKTSG